MNNYGKYYIKTHRDAFNILSNMNNHMMVKNNKVCIDEDLRDAILIALDSLEFTHVVLETMCEESERDPLTYS